MCDFFLCVCRCACMSGVRVRVCVCTWVRVHLRVVCGWVLGESVTDRRIVLMLVARIPGWSPRCDEDDVYLYVGLYVCGTSFYVCGWGGGAHGCVYVYEWCGFVCERVRRT